MSRLVPLLALLLVQDAGPAEQLRRGGWRAADALVEKGARAALEECTRDMDSDVAFLARAALAEIDAAGAPGLQALVRTEGWRAVSTLDAVPALFRKAGLNFSPSGLPDRTVTLPDGLPLLEALEILSKELDVEFYQGESGRWRATAGYCPTPRFAFRRFQARLDECRRETRVDFERPPTTSFTLRARLTGDGSVRLLGASNARVLEASDDRGTDLAAKSSAACSNPPAGHTLVLTLGLPAEEAVSIPKLRLSLDVILEKSRGTAKFDRSAGNAEQKVGPVVLRFKGSSRDGERIRCEIEVASDIPFQQTPWEGYVLADAEGKAWRVADVAVSGTGKRRTHLVSFGNPEKAGDPSTLSIDVVTEAAVRRVFLEFRDVSIR